MAPGLVQTNLFNGGANSHWSKPILNPLVSALTYALGVTTDDCGEYMWHGLYASTRGWFRYNRHGENVGDKNMWSTPEAKEKLWEHTLKETSV